MARLTIPVPVLRFLPPQRAYDFARPEEADDSRRDLDRLSLSLDPVDSRTSLDTTDEGARREMDLLSLSPETRPAADPRDELAFLSLTTRGL